MSYKCGPTGRRWSWRSPTARRPRGQVPRVREKDGLDIYPLYCLKCNYITEWAADPNNVSGKAIDGVEYFKTFKINKKFKSYFECIKNDLVNRGYTKSETIKYSIGWCFIIVGLIAFFN